MAIKRATQNTFILMASVGSKNACVCVQGFLVSVLTYSQEWAAGVWCKAKLCAAAVVVEQMTCLVMWADRGCTERHRDRN